MKEVRMAIKKISVSQILSDGFTKTFHNFLACLKGLFGMMLIGSLAVIGAILVNTPLVIKLMDQPALFWQQVQGCADNVVCFKTLLWPLLQGNIVVLTLSLIFLVLFFAWLLFGYIRYNLNVHDNGRASLKDLCMPLGKTIRYLIASFLALSIFVGGLLLLIIPGIYWGVRFSQFVYFIIEKDAGIIESLKMSWAATAGNFWRMFAVLLIINIITGIGGLISILIIVTTPLNSIIHACLYRSLTSDHGINNTQN